MKQATAYVSGIPSNWQIRLTTSTINRLRELYPQGRFEARRFRPNIVVSTGNEGPGFVENDWIGRTVLIGDTVRLAITEPCPRCVMITLPQYSSAARGAACVGSPGRPARYADCRHAVQRQVSCDDPQ
jgi:uncharacterized protein YcbX